jgi:hypothetical protein
LQEIYPLDIGDKFTLALASTLNADGTPDDVSDMRCIWLLWAFATQFHSTQESPTNRDITHKAVKRRWQTSTNLNM